MERKCVFCNLEKERDEGSILYETENFYVTCVKYGAFSAGHVLLISKFHLSCFGDMPNKYDEEFLTVANKVRQNISVNFSSPLASEMGVYGQSVNHAHIHFFPSRTDDYYIRNFVSIIPDAIQINRICELQELRDIFKQEKQYVSIEESSQLYVCLTREYNGSSIRLRDLFVKATGLESFARWQSIPNNIAENNRKWLCLTKEAWRQT